MKRVPSREIDNRRYQQDPGGYAETLAEAEYAGFSTALASDFDMANQSGSVIEVKSTQSVYPNNEKGRFRLFKSQHDRLVRADREGTAYYVFVVFDVSTRDVSAKMKRAKPARIGNVIAGRGGWYNAGHVAGKEYKMPIEAIF